jgi:cellobiose phosphorylase
MTQQFSDGSLVRSWLPLNKTKFSDEPLWLVNTTCDYIKYTEDTEFLEEIVDYLDGGSDTVWVHLLKAVNRVDSDRGPHNIPLSHFADWNDALNTGDADKNAESVFVAMQLAFAFKEMADLSEYLGKKKLSAEFSAKYEALKKTVNDCCWDDEGYYVRSFSHGKPIGSSLCERGAKIFVNPQSWSIISGVCPQERLSSVMAAVDKYIDTPVGCRVNYPAYSEADPALGRISFQYPGTNENGAVYAHATSFKMYADCMLGLGDRAYETYLKLLPSNPNNPPEVADTIPYAISNCCFTADVCYGKSSALPFGTGTQAWLFRTVIEGLLGVRFAYGGFNINPAFPSAWDKAEMTLQRGGANYKFIISNNNTGEKKIYVDGKPADSDFIPFKEAGDVEIRVEL